MNSVVMSGFFGKIAGRRGSDGWLVETGGGPTSDMSLGQQYLLAGQQAARRPGEGAGRLWRQVKRSSAWKSCAATSASSVRLCRPSLASACETCFLAVSSPMTRLVAICLLE